MIRSPKRVLLLLPSLKGGGAERVFSILLRHMDRRRVEPHLALLRAEGPYLQDIPPDVLVYELKASRARYSLPSIIRLIWKLRPQAVLSTLPPTNVALILSAPLFPRGTRIVLFEASFPSTPLANSSHPRLWTWLYRRLYKRADKVVCFSDSLIDEMFGKFNVPRQKMVRIYNPVDIQNVRKLAESGGNPYLGPGPHLVAAGRLSPEKGFDLLLAAMSLLRERLPHADLTILGEGPLAGELAAQAERLGLGECVCFAGFRQNPWPYFKHATTLVLPSRYEGLPNVVLEALALETPVVAFDCPGALRELQAGCPGLVTVPPEDPEALAEAIVSVCSVPAAARVRNASAILEKFDVAQIVSQYSDLLLG
jgi:glycosyltransferase involved in cell wall biosynthesis